ncbi:MAG TPA: hypothetical protein VHK91_09940 [Flavisolibacter sp.]|jgi:hypothetical protein|nr:hypothetical protein [Flavisolibacter sp.]
MNTIVRCVLALCLFALTACHKDKTPDPPTGGSASLSLSRAAITLPFIFDNTANDTTITVGVTASATWKFEVAATGSGWLSAEKFTVNGKDSLRLNVKGNATSAMRSSKITVSLQDGSHPVDLAIEQLPLPVVTVSRQTLSIGSLPGFSDTFTIEANVPWTLTVPDGNSWLSADKALGQPGKTIVKLTVGNNAPSRKELSLNVNFADKKIPVQLTRNPVASQFNIGGSSVDEIRSMIKTSDGGSLQVGSTSSRDQDISMGHGSKDILVIKFDNKGIRQWVKTYGGLEDDIAFSVTSSSDGGFVITGSTSSSEWDPAHFHAGNADLLVFKISADGNQLWSRVFGGNASEAGYSVISTTEGGFLVAGETSSSTGSGDIWFNHNSGNSDGWVLKLKADGDTSWTRSFGGSAYDVFESVIAATDGTYILGGRTRSDDGDVTNNGRGWDGWLIKFKDLITQQPEIKWSKKYGGSVVDRIQSLAATSNGGCIAVGYSNSQDGDLTGALFFGTNGWILGIDGSGATLFNKTIGGNKEDELYTLIPMPDGNYAAAGYSSSIDGNVSEGNGSGDAWLVLISSNGNLVQSVTYGSTNGIDQFYSLVLLPDGSLWAGGAIEGTGGDVVGYFDSRDAWLVKPR